MLLGEHAHTIDDKNRLTLPARFRHVFGDGIVVSARLTRDDEEVTVAFRDGGVGHKTMLASLANLELIG